MLVTAIAPRRSRVWDRSFIYLSICDKDLSHFQTPKCTGQPAAPLSHFLNFNFHSLTRRSIIRIHSYSPYEQLQTRSDFDQRSRYWKHSKKMDWKSLAKTKRDSVNALIPKSWLLSTPLPSASEQKDVTGKFIQQFLTAKEVEITETDAVGIVKNTTSGTWKAREVAEAFCHRAALAHQMVYPILAIDLRGSCTDE